MFDEITIGSLLGLIILGWAWTRASKHVWYYDSDNEPVSVRAIIGWIWMVCLLVLVLKLFNG